jgi:hypothetical protein
MHLPVEGASAACVSRENQLARAPVNYQYFSLHNMHRESSHFPSEEQRLTIDASKNASLFQLQT